VSFESLSIMIHSDFKSKPRSFLTSTFAVLGRNVITISSSGSHTCTRDLILVLVLVLETLVLVLVLD